MKTSFNFRLALVCSSFMAALLLTRCGVDNASTTESAGAPRGAEITNPRPGIASSTIAYIDTTALANRRSITNEEMLASMSADLRTVSSDAQIFTRYLSLTNQYNSGASDRQLEIFRFALAKAINSLSYEPKIVVPVAIDAEKTIFRIDIRDYRWNRQIWEEIAIRDPYAILTRSKDENDLRRLAQVQRLPFARADWFVENALQGNLYNIIMRLPGNIQNVEFSFGVNADANIQQGRVKRAGFNGSGVSSQSRMVEWHQSKRGSYWKSYDFKPEQGQSRRNIFEFALDIRNFGNGFDHGGGEMIFQLANGLQLYLLTDNQGRQLQIAPVDIVTDPVRPGAAVVNAISCYRCHHSGMLPLARGDEIRNHVEKNSFAFSSRELDLVRSLYPGTAVINTQIADDNRRFAEAIAQLGENPIELTNDTNEPIFQLAQRFESEMQLPMVAAELGMTPEVFQEKLLRSNFLSRRIGQIRSGSTLKREVFEDNFQFMVQQFGLGQVFNPR